MNKYLKYFTHMYSLWITVLISLFWILRYDQINTVYLIGFICGSILPCIQLYRYYIRKSIDIWGNKIG